MAKRTRPQESTNQANDTDRTTTAKPPRTRSARSADKEPPAPEPIAHFSTEELPDIPEPGDAADRAARSESMSSEPSEEDIRLRAYQRYLERGGGHGLHFDDWLEAERELKDRRS